MTDHLLRSLAPISDSAWSAIDEEARSRLSAHLAARKLVDFIGPSGWQHSATSLGRTTGIDSPFDGVDRGAARRSPVRRAAGRLHTVAPRARRGRPRCERS